MYDVPRTLLPNKFVQAVMFLIYRSGGTLLRFGLSYQLPTAQEISVMKAMDARVRGFMAKDEFLLPIPEASAHCTCSLQPTRNS
jgi:hypothetical protein